MENKEKQEQEDKERIDNFNKELSSLCTKYEVAIGAIPKILADGRVAADPIIVNNRKEENTESEEVKLDNPDA